MISIQESTQVWPNGYKETRWLVVEIIDDVMHVRAKCYTKDQAYDEAMRELSRKKP